jgi:hypothetical protein
VALVPEKDARMSETMRGSTIAETDCFGETKSDCSLSLLISNREPCSQETVCAIA